MGLPLGLALEVASYRASNDSCSASTRDSTDRALGKVRVHGSKLLMRLNRDDIADSICGPILRLVHQNDLELDP